MVLRSIENAPVLSLFSLTGKTCVVTGGARGIGLEIVKGFCEAGASVAIVYATSTQAPQVARDLSEEFKTRVEAYQADVRSRESIENAITAIVKDFGKIDTVVANSGVVHQIGAINFPEEKWRDTFAVNVDGVFYTCQAAAPHFKRQGYGSIVITGSVSATLVNIPQQQAAYNASKAAVVHLAKSLAVEFVDFARVNVISPGFIYSDMTEHVSDEWKRKWKELIPGKRTAYAYELKGAYLFAASDASSYMTGANIIVDGGYTLP